MILCYLSWRHCNYKVSYYHVLLTHLLPILETLAHQERYLGWRIETGIQEATKDILEGGFDNGVTVHTLGKKVGY